MPKKKDDLQEVVKALYTLNEASEWIAEHNTEFNLRVVPNPDTLKKACKDGRLKAVIKGRTYLTREPEIRDYLKKFDPKNKTESRPLQPRAKKKRETVEQTATAVASE